MDTSGTITFLFTDLEGSTRLWEKFPDAMKDALSRHDAILRESIERARGRVVKTTGDGMMAVFTSASDAVAATLSAQQDLAHEPWTETGPLRVRMGVHTGQADERGGDYFGPSVNRTARLMAAGHGGQILLSATSGALAEDDLPTGTTLVDLGEHRLKDIGRPEHVYQLKGAGLTATFPPLATLRQATAELPARVAELFGRTSELLQIKQLLTGSSVRLVTLTGPGGTGKTTLALRAAEDLESSFADGAAFVDLSNARDTGAVLVAIARAVGIDDVVERPLDVELIDHLRARTMLVVLDNLEQVTEGAAATVTRLMRECPGLSLLATSRQVLHVRAERVLQIPPLSLPPQNTAHASALETGRYESVRLFVDRAQTVRPDFELTDENAAAVAEICRRLDGLPLAIELAAVRLRLFSPDVLKDRLGDRLSLLRSGPRDLPERQQTLRATMDWSYDLLEPRERLLFELLGRFADTEITAVEGVVESLGEVDGMHLEPLDGLASLVEQSLIRQIDVPGGEPRVVMLETIREFAVDRLDQRPDFRGRAERAHAAYFAKMAHGLRSDLTSNRRQTALAALAADSGNLRIAWAYWVTAADLVQLNKLAGPLMTLDDARGWYLNTVDLTTDMLAVLASSPTSPDLVETEISLRINLARALMATKGLTQEVEDAFTSAIELFERGANVGQQFSVLRGLASLYVFRAQLEQVAKLGREILALGAVEHDSRMLIEGHLLVGTYEMSHGDLSTGAEHFETAIALIADVPTQARTVKVGNDSRVACYTTSAFTLRLLGYPDRAAERADAALALAAELDHPFTSAYARFHAGVFHLWQREPETAHALAVGVLEIADEHGFRIWTAAGSCLRGAARVHLGHVDEGLADVRSGMDLYQELRSPPVFWPFLLFVDAGASYAAGRLTDGLRQLEVAIEILSAGRGASMLPELHVLKGDFLLAMAGEDPDVRSEVESWYRRALDFATQIDARMTQLRAATRIARLELARGDAEAARGVLQPVYATFDEGFTGADLVEAGALLAALE